MRFSTRSRYGLRAMVELALNYSPDQPIPLVRVAESQNISEGYLEQLMTFLRKGGLVRSVRGPQGGYLLTRQPSKISAGEVIRCLEGPISPTGCVREGDPDICDRAVVCITRVLWQRVGEAVASVLDNTTLEELCKEAEKLRQKQEAEMYFI